jgi:hypothetical protein
VAPNRGAFYLVVYNLPRINKNAASFAKGSIFQQCEKDLGLYLLNNINLHFSTGDIEFEQQFRSIIDFPCNQTSVRHA